MAAVEKATVVLMPGAWHDDSCYAEIASLLEKAGVPFANVLIPSVDANPAHETFDEDVQEARRVLEDLIEKQGKSVVTFHHSYAGHYGQPAMKGLTVRERQRAGKPGGIKGMVFAASWMTSVGDIMAAPPEVDMSWADFRPPLVWVRDASRALYHDLSAAQQRRLVARLRPQSLNVFMSPQTHEAYRDAPVTYIVAQRDHAMPAWVQMRLVEKALANGADIKVVHFDTSHTVQVAAPEDCVKVIMEHVEA